MILKSLVDLYDAMSSSGEVPHYGWCLTGVSFAARIDSEGNLVKLISMKIPSGKNGDKEVPQQMEVPYRTTRTSGIKPYFMCDKSDYIFGLINISDDGKEKSPGNNADSQKKFTACKDLHITVLKNCNSPAASRIINFFTRWDPDKAMENGEIASHSIELIGGGNIVFQDEEGNLLQNDPAIRAAWGEYLTLTSSVSNAICLVTGKKGPVARTHPQFKGIPGAQATGAALVSFNRQAFESYGHEQGDNAPVIEETAFKYGTALSSLLKDRDHVEHFYSTTVVFWSVEPDLEKRKTEQDIFDGFFFPGKTMTNDDLKGIVSGLVNERKCDFNGISISYDNQFYILGLAPNAGRLAVEFFLQDSFGNFIMNLQEHYQRLNIIGAKENGYLSTDRLLKETINNKSDKDKPSKAMENALINAILLGYDYPASLLQTVISRIRTEHDVNWRKAAIIKAYFLKNQDAIVPKEVANMELNENSNYVPYVLGRLFAVMEKIQTDAVPGIKTTIKDRYLASASSTPSLVFPNLIALSQHHIEKIKDSFPGRAVYYDKLMTELMSSITTTFPARLSIQDQGAFYLGYYHQKEALYSSKSEKVENSNEIKEDL